jgi:tRNA-specific 2-thiouridylase
MNIDQKLQFLKAHGIDLSKEQYLHNSSKRVIVGMSGGVDSSVTALLVKLQGYETIGIFMKNWDEVDENGHCSAEDDYRDAQKVCDQLEIPCYAINFVDEYRENVFSHFLEEYKKGHTPNPDILCNREIKFKVFYEKARNLGADYLATGHYCQKETGLDGVYLKKGKDLNKDQSYFLYAIESNVLENVLFPIGHLDKPVVRQIANEFQLATSLKKDSTGICFIGERNFKEFLSNYIDSQKGDFVELDNNQKLGVHDGVCFYTKGQRKGLGLGGPGGPWFVADKDMTSNTVYVVQGEDHPALFSNELIATDVTWITHPPKKKSLTCKVRYRQTDQDCEISFLENNKILVKFPKYQRAITERQSVVFYDGDLCLGGAIIESVGESLYQSRTHHNLGSFKSRPLS